MLIHARCNHIQIWPLFLLNLNLPRRDRVKKENIIPVGFIPGPKSPGDIDTFLQPLIDEMLILHNGITEVYYSYSQTKTNLLMLIYVCCPPNTNN